MSVQLGSSAGFASLFSCQRGVQQVNVDREANAADWHPEAAEDFPPLAETPAAYDSNFYIDWASSFVHLVEDNVRAADGRQADNAANKRLGEILGALRTGS